MLYEFDHPDKSLRMIQAIRELSHHHVPSPSSVPTRMPDDTYECVCGHNVRSHTWAVKHAYKCKAVLFVARAAGGEWDGRRWARAKNHRGDSLCPRPRHKRST